jgi:hypothetical protein
MRKPTLRRTATGRAGTLAAGLLVPLLAALPVQALA